jgi:hypothetical protein
MAACLLFCEWSVATAAAALRQPFCIKNNFLSKQSSRAAAVPSSFTTLLASCLCIVPPPVRAYYCCSIGEAVVKSY